MDFIRHGRFFTKAELAKAELKVGEILVPDSPHQSDDDSGDLDSAWKHNDSGPFEFASSGALKCQEPSGMQSSNSRYRRNYRDTMDREDPISFAVRDLREAFEAADDSIVSLPATATESTATPTTSAGTTESLPFKCPACGETFPAGLFGLDRLVNHYQRHTGEKPYWSEMSVEKEAPLFKAGYAELSCSADHIMGGGDAVVHNLVVEHLRRLDYDLAERFNKCPAAAESKNTQLARIVTATLRSKGDPRIRTSCRGKKKGRANAGHLATTKLVIPAGGVADSKCPLPRLGDQRLHDLVVGHLATYDPILAGKFEATAISPASRKTALAKHVEQSLRMGSAMVEL